MHHRTADGTQETLSRLVMRPMAAPPEVRVLNLAKQYPRGLWSLVKGARRPRQALRAVSFDIMPGEVVALIGPNGAGKSTLLRILAGLLHPTSGTAEVAQLNVVRDRPRSRQVVGAVLSEDRGLSPRLTVRQNLAFFGAVYGLNSSEASERIRDLSARFESAQFLPREVRTLSSGERARAVLIRALLHRPRVVLVDELTRSLDPGAAVRLRKQILAEVAGRGAAVLFASHDLAEVEAIASRVLLLHRGETRAFGPFFEVKRAADAVFASDPSESSE